MDENEQLEDLNEKHQEIVNSRKYTDYLYQLEVLLSTFTVLSYDDLVKGLKHASGILQMPCPFYSKRNQSDSKVITLLGINEHHFSQKMDMVRLLISLITRITPIALPVLRNHSEQMINNLRAAIYDASEHNISEYTPTSHAGRAWDSIKHFHKLTQQELPNLMKLTGDEAPDIKTAHPDNA